MLSLLRRAARTGCCCCCFCLELALTRPRRSQHLFLGKRGEEREFGQDALTSLPQAQVLFFKSPPPVKDSRKALYKPDFRQQAGLHNSSEANLSVLLNDDDDYDDDAATILPFRKSTSKISTLHMACYNRLNGSPIFTPNSRLIASLETYCSLCCPNGSIHIACASGIHPRHFQPGWRGSLQPGPL